MTLYGKVISSDSHVVEPPNLWEDRMDPKFGTSIPHLRKGDAEDPYDWWYYDNIRMGPTGAIAAAGKRFTNPQEIIQAGVFDNVRPGVVRPGGAREGYGPGRRVWRAGLSVYGAAPLRHGEQ